MEIIKIYIIREQKSINFLNVTEQSWKPPDKFTAPTRTVYKLAEQPKPPGDEDQA